MVNPREVFSPAGVGPMGIIPIKDRCDFLGNPGKMALHLFGQKSDQLSLFGACFFPKMLNFRQISKRPKLNK